MDRKIGSCSICGGDVVAYEGPWMATVPPPPPHCTSCGAVTADSERVIKMVRPRSAWGVR